MSIREQAKNELRRFLLIRNQEGKKVRWGGKLWDPGVLLDELDRNTYLSRQLIMGREITLMRKRKRRAGRLICLVCTIALISTIALVLM